MGHGQVPFDEQLGAMFELQKEGKIQHVALSNVSPEELETGLSMGEIATVENLYGYVQCTTLREGHGETRGGEEVLALCEQHGIPLVPFFSLVHGLPKAGDKPAELARKYQVQVSEAQLTIVWLLHKSPWLLPILSTSSLAHLRENLKAADIELSPADMAYLS